MNFIDNIINGLRYLSPADLADTIITILKFLLDFFAKFWSLLSTNIIDYDFTILGTTIEIEISLLFMLTIGGFILFVWFKLFALIPIVPE